MINMGAWRDSHWPDGWTAVTKDGLPSAQFEHTMVVTENGSLALPPLRVLHDLRYLR